MVEERMSPKAMGSLFLLSVECEQQTDPCFGVAFKQEAVPGGLHKLRLGKKVEIGSHRSGSGLVIAAPGEAVSWPGAESMNTMAVDSQIASTLSTASASRWSMVSPYLRRTWTIWLAYRHLSSSAASRPRPSRICDGG